MAESNLPAGTPPAEAEPSPEQAGQAQRIPTPPSRATIQEFHIGPLPHPQLLAEYNQVVPGLAERIATMMERQSAHRQEMERRLVEGGLKNSSRGTVFAFGLGITALAIAFGCACVGQGAAASVIGGATLVGLTSAFIYGTHMQKQTQDKPVPPKKPENQ